MFKQFRYFNVVFILTLLLGLTPATGLPPAAQAAPAVSGGQGEGFSPLALTESATGGEVLAPTATMAPTANDGALDLTFNPGGANDTVYALALQPDGKMLIGGVFSVPRYRIARLNADGSLDTTFDPYPGSGANDDVYALALQPDGKLVIGGRFVYYNGVAHNRIARLNADASLDTSFNPGSGANDIVLALALQPDGKILIGGSFTTYNGVWRPSIARLNADGSLDTTFNPGSGANEVVSAFALQPDGKILIGGGFTEYDGVARNRIARINADGSLDTSFNPGSGADYSVSAFTLQPDGKILIGGVFFFYNGVARSRIARVNADGSLDTTFNPGSGANYPVWALALQPDGKILLGGDFRTYNGVARYRIARVDADGSLDTSFDPDSGANDYVLALALQPDGKLVIGGEFTTYNWITRNRIARVYGYTPAPALSKSVTPATLAPGGPLTYTLRLTNLTTATLTSIVLTDTLPVDMLNPQVSSSVPITARTGTRYVWDVSDLAPGASALIALTGQVSATPSGDSIVNTAQFSSNFGSGAAAATAYFPGVFVTKTGSGSGRVTSAPPGIDCGVDCSQVYAVGASVTLTPTPVTGHQFCGWYGDAACSGTGACNITVSGAHHVEARFAAGQNCDATIGAVRNGDWHNPRTWSLGRVPDVNDSVEIPAGVTVTAPPERVTVYTLYQDGTIQSARNAPLQLRVWDTLHNTGVIQGQTGGSTIGATCGAPGSAVLLGGGTLRNTGVIQGGAGRGGSCCGGAGGNVSLSFGVVDNSSAVVGGAGGSVICCATSTPGHGGSVTINAGDRNQGLRSSGDIHGGQGGDQATGCGDQHGGCGGSIALASQPIWIAWNAGNPFPTLTGGRSGLNTDGTTGQCGGAGPDVRRRPVIRVEPNDLVISHTLVTADDIIIFGGADWEMVLRDTPSGFISATHGITLAVGAGGSIDLRGSEAGAFTAPRFFIASDSVLLDAGKTLADIVDADDIVEAGAQILGAIELSAPGYARGQRGESFAIPIELVNNSPITFTYDLEAISDLDIPSGGLPAVVSIGPVSSTVVTLTVSAPALGGEQAITVTATAQASPFQSDSAVIRLYAPPEEAAAALDQTFTGGVFYPFTGTLNCGGVTFAETWTGQLGVTLGEAATTTQLLPHVYTVTVGGGTPPAATLALCYDETATDAAGVPAEAGLYLHAGAGWLPAQRAADDAVVTAEVSLPGVWRIGAPRFSLAVGKTGDGHGVVGETWGALSCGLTCTVEYWAQTPVQLEAAPAPGHFFAGWSGAVSGMQNPITVTMDADKSVTARFTLDEPQEITHTLTLATAGMGSGIITPTVGAHSYLSGTAVTLQATAVNLQATANMSSTFAGWSGDADCTDGSVTMDADKACTATFNLAEAEYRIYLPLVLR